MAVLVWLDALGRQSIRTKKERVFWVQGKRNVLWRDEVKLFLEYNGREPIKKKKRTRGPCHTGS